MSSILKSSNRIGNIPSIKLSFEDLKTFVDKLKNKNQEALGHELTSYPKMPGDAEDDYKGFRKKIEDNFNLTIGIYGTNGEQIILNDLNDIQFKDVPKRINNMIIDSAFSYRLAFNYDPINRLYVNIDFTRNSIFDIRNIQTIYNKSSFNITGRNETWVNGVYSEIVSYFKEFKTLRVWYHNFRMVNLFTFYVFVPFLFWVLYRIDVIVKNWLPEANAFFYIPLYFYIVVFILFAYRIIYNFGKILYPYIELDNDSRKLWLRVTFVTIVVSSIAAFVYDILKMLLKII